MTYNLIPMLSFLETCLPSTTKNIVTTSVATTDLQYETTVASSDDILASTKTNLSTEPPPLTSVDLNPAGLSTGQIWTSTDQSGSSSRAHQEMKTRGVDHAANTSPALTGDCSSNGPTYFKGPTMKWDFCKVCRAGDPLKILDPVNVITAPANLGKLLESPLSSYKACQALECLFSFQRIS